MSWQSWDDSLFWCNVVTWGGHVGVNRRRLRPCPPRCIWHDMTPQGAESAALRARRSRPQWAPPAARWAEWRCPPSAPSPAPSPPRPPAARTEGGGRGVRAQKHNPDPPHWDITSYTSTGYLLCVYCIICFNFTFFFPAISLMTDSNLNLHGLKKAMLFILRTIFVYFWCMFVYVSSLSLSTEYLLCVCCVFTLYSLRPWYNHEETRVKSLPETVRLQLEPPAQLESLAQQLEQVEAESVGRRVSGWESAGHTQI